MCHHFNLFSATWDSSEWQMAAAATTLQVVLVFEQFSFTEFPKMWIYRLFPMSDQISYPPPVRMWINRYIDFFPCQMSYHPPCQALHCTEEGCRPFRLSHREGAGRYLGWCSLWRHRWDDVFCILCDVSCVCGGEKVHQCATETNTSLDSDRKPSLWYN